MNRLVLSQIVKNESHCILTSLNYAIKEICDMVVYVDTCSTDNTKEVILNWGKENNIPAFVFEKQFDNFENCRNYAMEMARQMADKHGWKKDETWTMWLDADETALIDPKVFNKQKMDKDLYMANTFIGNMKYTRNTFARMNKPFKFYGPVHEFIVCDEDNITSGLAEGVHVDVKMIGKSWQGDISKKYLDHAHKLEAYIAADRKDPRWIFYTAQSYHDSASMRDNRDENEERLRRSIKYYKERVKRTDGYPEEIYYSQYRIGTIMRIIEEPWNLTHMELLKAYSMDPMRGESIKTIIDYYLQIGDWNMAYLYTKFSKVNFHGKNPYPTRLLFVDEAIYVWKFAEAHAAACYYTGRMQEAKETFKEIMEISKTHTQYFTPEDLKKIESNAQFFLKN
jgi:glycosyltransferase involved in cell wall biosynthesis